MFVKIRKLNLIINELEKIAKGSNIDDYQYMSKSQ